MNPDKLCFVAVQFAYAMAVIGTLSFLMHLRWGWVGSIIYLAFACLCMTPAILAARNYVRNK